MAKRDVWKDSWIVDEDKDEDLKHDGWLSDEDHNRLLRIADKMNLTENAVVCLAVREFLTKH